MTASTQEKTRLSGERKIQSTSLFLPMRSDLDISIVPRGSTRVAVVKDPVSHRFFEMDPSDVEIARNLRADVDSKTQLAILRTNCPLEADGLDDDSLLRRASRISAELAATGLSRGKSHSDSAFVRGRSRKSLIGFLRTISQVLFLRFRLFDPSCLMNATASWASPFFSVWFVFISLAGFLISAAFFVGHGGVGDFDAAWFASPVSLLALYVCIALLKFLHEAGHAFAVHHYGGKTHEVGLTLVAGLPLFHVEVSDSYLFAKKSQRLAVASAGIIIELFACALLTLLWLVLAEGFARQLVAHLVIISGISTLLFNGNPLMRYDGYFILADAVDMPDLRERARAFVSGSVAALLSGTRLPATRSRREACLLGLYGTASTAYLLIVFFGIWKFLSAALAPHGLKWLSDILVLSWAATSLIAPAISSLKNIVARVKSSPASGQKRALLIVTTAFALAVIGFAIPLPRKITCNGILQPASTTSVRATEEGCVVKILVSEGERVAAGQPLALLENHALMRDAETAKSAEKTARTRLRSAMAATKTSAVGLLQSELLTAESSLREANRRLEGVTLRSPTEGIVASRRLDAFLGTRLAPGGVFCDIRPAVLDEFLVTFGEKEARLVHAGARAVVRFRALPGKSFIGVVAAPPLRLAKPPPGQPAPAPGSDSHFANITLSNPDDMLKIGMTGRVQIERGRESLFQFTLEALLDFLHLDIRMR